MTPQNEDKWREDIMAVLGADQLETRGRKYKDRKQQIQLDILLAWAADIDKQARKDELQGVLENGDALHTLDIATPVVKLMSLTYDRLSELNKLGDV